jgi:hypothetical protein
MTARAVRLVQGSLGPVPTQATAIGLLQLSWNEIAQGGGSKAPVKD